MPIATHVLSGDFSGLVGEISSIRATINTNSADGGWVNDVDNVIVLGGTVLAVGADGKFTVTLPTSTGTGLQYQVTAEFTDGSRERKTWDSGWFSLTGSGDLADLANDSSLRVTATLGDQLAARIDTLEAGGGTSSLTVASGGSVDLDDTKPDGYLVGYKVTAPTTFEGVSFAAGSYIFERDSSIYGGWTYRTLATSTAVAPAPEAVPPTAGTLTASAVTTSGFRLTVTGATDDTALHATPYAFSTDNGTTWSAYQAAAFKDYTGRASGTAYQCKHRVRDASGNVTTGTAITVTTGENAVPPTITGLSGWWDASDASTFTYSSGTAVSQWRDKSGLDHHFAQATTSKQPARTGTQNSRATLVFDGTTDELRTAAFTLGQPLTVFVAFNFDRSLGMGILADNTGTFQMWSSPPSGIAAQGSSGNFVFGTSLDDTSVPFVAAFQYNGATSEIWYNGVSSATGTTGTGAIANGLVLGNQTSDNPFKGQIFEVIVYAGVLSTANRQTVESYLMSRWGIA